jgi:beta-phosphoglucomutase-like phosphatase (HAD superfamily)
MDGFLPRGRITPIIAERKIFFEPHYRELAAAKLGVAPETRRVFEDADMGIETATGARMNFVKVPPRWERGAFSSAKLTGRAPRS